MFTRKKLKTYNHEPKKTPENHWRLDCIREVPRLRKPIRIHINEVKIGILLY